MAIEKNRDKDWKEMEGTLRSSTTVRIDLDPKTMEKLGSARRKLAMPKRRKKAKTPPTRTVPKYGLVEEDSVEDAVVEEQEPLRQPTTTWIDLTKPAAQQVIQVGADVPVEEASEPSAETQALGNTEFRELLESIYDGCLITDREGLVLSANARANHYFRRTEPDFRGMAVTDVIAGATSSLLTTIWETLENDQFVLLQAECDRADGSAFPAEISVNAFHLGSEMCLGFFIRDITLRKETEERLKTGFNAIQNSGDGIVIADNDSLIGSCNPTALGLLGYSVMDEMRGKSFVDFLADRDMATEILQTVNHEVKTWRGELKLQRQDESIFFAQVSVAPNLSFEGELLGLVLSFLDVTERKLTQQKLEAYAKKLSDHNRQMAEDLEMAKEIQRALLPSRYPVFPAGAAVVDSALRFQQLYIPSSAVGGDFFNVLRISNTHAGVFISDVMGHGMRAALVTATLRGLIEELSSVAHDPGVFLTQLNQAYNSIFGGLSDEMLYATAAYLMIDITTGRMRYSNAGHPLPCLLHRKEKRVEAVELSEGAMGAGIGLFPDSVYDSDERMLEEGDLLLQYTDGLLESINDKREYYEDVRFMDALNDKVSLPAEQLLDELVADARDFSGSEEFDDDVCLLTMEVARLGAQR